MVVPPIMQWLAGTWYIISTDAPLWLDGRKQSPSLNYSLIERGEEWQLLDETKYLKNGIQKTITGYDKLSQENDKSFTWRGKGVLFIAKSEWEVRLQDPEGMWAVITYSKTIFTPAGADIISRKKHLTATAFEAIHQQMLQDSILKNHAERMKVVLQQ